MKNLALAAVLALGISTAAHGAVITTLGINPTSATGSFNNSVGGATFSDEYTFTLVGAPQFITFSSATNVFTGPEDFITSFTGQLFTSGGTAVSAPVAATDCPSSPTGCQILAGSA